MYMQGETITKEKNHVRLSKDKVDQWGIPLLVTSVDYDDNDEKMVKDFLQQGSEMFESAGGKVLETIDNKQPPGLDIHEMGGVRMGKDPKTSMLNAGKSTTSLQECFCNRWCMYDQHRKSKPVDFVHGADSKSG